MKKIITLLILATLFVSCGDNSSPISNSDTIKTEIISYVDVTPDKAKLMIETTGNIVVVDVSPHYTTGHIPGSINFYIGDGSLDSAVNKLDTSFTYLVYCHVDAASIPGAQAFVDAGFKKVYRLEGNYGAWTTAAYDVETSTDSYIDLSPATVKTLIDADPMVVTIDVSGAYADGHLPMAVNYEGAALDAAITMFDATKTYIIYCHGDAPSIAGATKVFEAGFTPTYRLKGNYGAWIAAGFPVE